MWIRKSSDCSWTRPFKELISSIFDKHSMLQQTQSQPNHTSYRNFHFNEFVGYALHVECAKTRKYPKPDPTRNFRVSSGLTWETWNFMKWNLTRPGPEFSGSGFFSGFSGFEDYVVHPTNSRRGVKRFREISAAACWDGWVCALLPAGRQAVQSWCLNGFKWVRALASLSASCL